MTGRLSEDPRVAAHEVAARLTGVEGRLSFFSLVSLLERALGAAGKLGSGGPASEEPVRFRHDPALGFSSGDVKRVKAREVPSDPNNPLSPPRPLIEVMTTFLGLTGSASPLPLYFAEEIAQEEGEHPAKRELLDLFHHRLLALLFRGHASYSLSADLRKDAKDPWSRRLLALSGHDTYEHPPTTSLPPARLLRLSALLSQRARTAQGLTQMLEDVLGGALKGARVLVRQFAGKWVEIETEQRMQLGRSNTVLGRGSVVGRKVYDRAGSFELEIGPLDQVSYKRFLPDGDLLPVVRETVSLFLRDPLDFELVLVLEKHEAPALRLAAGEYRGSRLGRDSWLGKRKDADTRVRVEVEAA